MNLIRKILRSNKGMTFIELIVVLSIFSIISGIMLFNFSSFASAISLQNLANDIALSVNEAQKTAIYGRDLQNSTVTIPAYGIHFDLNDPKSFYKFIDSNINSTSENYFGNYRMDSANLSSPDCTTNNEECLLKYSIETSDRISGFTSSTQFCSGVISGYIDIAFKRPFPDPKITYTDSSGAFSACKDLTITLTSGQNTTKSITISALGQILVNDK